MNRIIMIAAALLAMTSIAQARCIQTGDVMHPCAYEASFLAGVTSIKVTMHRERINHKAYSRRHKSTITASEEITPSWGGGGLVSTARAYVGTNPTGWRHVWCGRFIAMIAPSVAAKVRNPNMAKAYLALRHTNGNVGDLAVMGRRGGGHVGIVSGFDAAGNPIVVSGNAGGGIVREGTYDRRRILAFVSAE